MIKLTYFNRRFWLCVNGLPMAKLPFQMNLKQVREVVSSLNREALA